jgi:hypothetical protein
MPRIKLQPKQVELQELFDGHISTWLGMGGGRGAAKSAAADRIMIQRRLENPGTIGAILMRNYDQVKRYHIDPLLRDYPELNDQYHITEKKIVFPMPEGPPSELHFTYGESLEDIERRFRSASYFDVIIDQAEQFSEKEIREVKQAVRWKNTKRKTCKMALLFNMGGAGISFLSKKFHEHEYNQREQAEDFAFIHVRPWDNIEWSRQALFEDGFETEEEQDHQYYMVMTDAEREEYCASRSDYGHTLNSQDEVLRNRDWKGSWTALEGAYFGRVFDRDATVISDDKVALLLKPWLNRWMSQDWGKGHYCTTQWHARGVLSPKEAKEILGWNVSKPVKFCLTYREYIAGGAADSDEGAEREISESDIARQMVERTPKDERKQVGDFWMSPDAFEMSVRRAGQSEIAEIIGDVLSPEGLPRPQKADNSRVDGWSLMYNMLLATKRFHATQTKKVEPPNDEVWLIAANCPELIRSIPLLMRDPKNLDDVLKTDKQSAKLEQDCGDTARYGLKSKLKPAEKPKEEQRKDALQSRGDMTDKYLENLKFEQEWQRTHKPLTRPSRFSRGRAN